MAYQKSKDSRSLIPIPTKFSKSLQKLPQITSSEKSISNSSKFISITTSTERQVTRNVSISQVPTSGSIAAKSCPSIVKSVGDDHSGKRDSLRSDVTSISISSKGNSSVKSMVKSTSNKSYELTKNIGSNANIHIHNKFSPYYEQQSLDYSNDSMYLSNKISDSPEMESSISSTESCISKEKQEISSVIDSNDSLLYRTQSVPGRKVTTVHANDDNWMFVEKSIISQLKDKMELTNDTNGEGDQNENSEKSGIDININVSPNVENKLLRIVIHHLREQLNESKHSIEKLNQQLSSNKQVTEAFQKSLSAMTIRAQQLTQQLETKDKQIDNLLIDIRDKKLQVEHLNKKISSIECELRQRRKSVSIEYPNNGNNIRNDSSMSTLSYLETSDDLAENKKSRNNWLKGSSLSKAFRRKKKSSKGKTESITELRNMLRDKEMTITDLRLESLATNNRLEKLEDALKSCREETNHLKRNKEFLERMIKSKIIE